jgi:hypothetical protein
LVAHLLFAPDRLPTPPLALDLSGNLLAIYGRCEPDEELNAGNALVYDGRRGELYRQYLGDLLRAAARQDPDDRPLAVDAIPLRKRLR